MTDPIKRKETTHIDEVARTATSTVQWFAEMRNKRGNASYPITHNNRLAMFVCGEEGCADIARQIRLAEKSIDICCWGFDPGMELARGGWRHVAARRHVRRFTHRSGKTRRQSSLAGLV
nr:hypothetical protein [uncultured Duganella sp.]